ncbi:hypothetical protein CFP65_3566 [Kitasatospora sp. MMS16-BH015]|uniref:hypothetical protein n=1 Tax=Kitasatospora sp. MMS16-BH015 TaxID=2018025 RepID=UPI000CA3A20A|nr:hypothetical protein [Kitasatospora sp. MMS16-BH015]AUG78356.1 hypothetical protein CFP65_3566 [Kitasatospora sp. MMS16-BH015]
MNILKNLKQRRQQTAQVDLTTVDPSESRLPVWFFGFEGVLAGAFDILKAFPHAWPALVVLGLVNITVSLTMLRRRVRLAKALWRGKETRKVAFGLLGLRLGSHALLHLADFAVTSVLGHLAFALVMATVTVGLLAWTQEIALRALAAQRAKATEAAAPAAPAEADTTDELTIAA